MSANLNLVDLLRRKLPNPFDQPRQPMDERLPDGRSPADLLRQTGSPPQSSSNTTPNIGLQRAALGVPNGDVVAALKRQTTDTPLEDRRVPLPEPPTADPLSVDTRRMGSTERQAALVDKLRTASPSSKVKQTATSIEEEPPQQSPSRVKNALLGLLLGTAQGGIGGGIAGAAAGAIKPELIQRLQRDQQVARESGQLGQQLGLEDKRADIDYRQAQAAREAAQAQTELAKPELERQKAEREAAYRNEQLKIQREVEAGRMTRDVAQRKLTELQRRETERHNREDERLQGLSAGQRGQETPASVADRSRKSAEAGETADKKYKRASGYWSEALQKEQEAAAIKTTTSDGYVDASATARQKQLLDEAADLKKRTRALQEEGDELKAKVGGAPQSAPAAKSRDGKYHYTMAQIQQQADAEGVAVDEVMKLLKGNPSVVIDQ